MRLEIVRRPSATLKKLVKEARAERVNWIATTWSETTPTVPNRLRYTMFPWRLRWYSVASPHNRRFVLIRIGRGELGGSFVLLYENKPGDRSWNSILIYPDSGFRASEAMRSLRIVSNVRGMLWWLDRSAETVSKMFNWTPNNAFFRELEDAINNTFHNELSVFDDNDPRKHYFLAALRYFENPCEENLLNLESFAVVRNL